MDRPTFVSVDDFLKDIEAHVHTTAMLELAAPGTRVRRIPLKRVNEAVFGAEEHAGLRQALLEARDYAYLTLYTPKRTPKVCGWTCWVNAQGWFEGWRDRSDDVEAVMRDRADNIGEPQVASGRAIDRQPIPVLPKVRA